MRPPRNGRQRRDAPLLDASDGRGGSDALRAPDLRADRGRLAPSGARPEGDTVEPGPAKKLEAKPKYVVSTTRRDFPWSNTHHVEGDLARVVKALKKATPRDHPKSWPLLRISSRIMVFRGLLDQLPKLDVAGSTPVARSLASTQ